MTTYNPTKIPSIFYPSFRPSLVLVLTLPSHVMGSSKLQDCDYVFEDKQEPMHEAKTQLRKLKARQLLVHAQETLH